MSNIHPTAIIGPDVEIADNVTVGPFCVLEGNLKIGKGNTILERVSIRGDVTIGEDNIFFPNVAIGFSPQDLGFEGYNSGFGVKIGNGNRFREGVSIHAATKEERPTTIGNNNFMMAYSHVAHDGLLHNNVIMVNGSAVAGHGELMDNSILAGSSAIQQFSRVGRFAMVAGNQGIVKDLPPFMMCYHIRTVGSLNVIGLRRAGYKDHIKPLKECFRILYKSGMPFREAAKKIKEDFADDALCQELADFVLESKRGITVYYKNHHGIH